VPTESKWLPAQLTFGPTFMLLGLLHARVGPEMGAYDWIHFVVAGIGTLQLSYGLITLLKTSRATANEVAKLRDQLGGRASEASRP
jgi:hypothetical protein